MLRKSIIGFFLLNVFSAVAIAQDISSIFGVVELGKPLNIEKCIKKNSYQIKKSCIDEWGNLQIPENERPKWLNDEKYRDDAIRVKINNEVCVGVNVITSGLEVQYEVLKILEKKYGKSEVNELIEKTNAYGAKIKSIFAIWSNEKVGIAFEGVTKDINAGLITINTNEYIEEMQSIESKKKEL